MQSSRSNEFDQVGGEKIDADSWRVFNTGICFKFQYLNFGGTNTKLFKISVFIYTEKITLCKNAKTVLEPNF